MSMSISNMMATYTYSSGSTARPDLDTNRDGVWSKQEVSNYASDYEEATGVSIDVDGIFKEYDADESGTLTYSEYNSAISDDALGMELAQDLIAAEEETDATSSESTELSEWLSTLTDTQKISLTQSTHWAETTSSLISSMFGSDDDSSNSLTSILNAVTQYSNAKLYTSSQYIDSLTAAVDEEL